MSTVSRFDRCRWEASWALPGVADIGSLYGRLRNEVILGQYLDLRLAGPHTTDREAQVVAFIEPAQAAIIDLPFAAQAQLAGVAELIAQRDV